MRIVTADVLADAWTSALVVLTAVEAEFTLIAPPTGFFLTGFTLLLIWTETVPPCDGFGSSCSIFLTVTQLILSLRF